MKNLIIILVTIFISSILYLSCQTPEGGVVNKVLSDFGLREKPEGYVSETDKVFQRLSEIGNTEIKRLNQEGRKGEVKFEQKGPRGEYYKEVKVYEEYLPLDVNPVSHSGETGQSYVATIQYSYRVYRSAPKPTRIEAQDSIADIPTETKGTEIYKYILGPGGVWNGERGQKVKGS